MLTQVPFVDLNAQYAELQTEVESAVLRVLRGAAYILGPEVDAFEKEFAAYCDARFAIGVDSGTSALELALRALGIGIGDEVMTAANTFIATALAITATGAKPVFVDVNPLTYTLDPMQVERAITEKTRAILPVHLYGQPADMDAIYKIARRYELFVIEDACQAHGARYQGKRAGTLSDVSAFSFYPAKNLGAYGDGGAVVTNDSQLAKKIRMLREYGQSAKYHHEMLGFNHRLDSVQAAVLRVKLPYLDAWNQARREHAQAYDALLDANGVTIPHCAPYSEPVYHLYVICARDRDGLQAHLKNQGIGTGIHYPIPIHLQRAYRALGYGNGSFPVTESLATKILSLPMYAELSSEQIECVANAVNAYVSQTLPTNSVSRA